VLSVPSSFERGRAAQLSLLGVAANSTTNDWKPAAIRGPISGPNSQESGPNTRTPWVTRVMPPSGVTEQTNSNVVPGTTFV